MQPLTPSLPTAHQFLLEAHCGRAWLGGDELFLPTIELSGLGSLLLSARSFTSRQIAIFTTCKQKLSSLAAVGCRIFFLKNTSRFTVLKPLDMTIVAGNRVEGTFHDLGLIDPETRSGTRADPPGSAPGHDPVRLLLTANCKSRNK
jgi:small ligand-binding sensory domain FIST